MLPLEHTSEIGISFHKVPSKQLVPCAVDLLLILLRLKQFVIFTLLPRPN